MYGKINLVIQSQFTSSYALALYENCVRYKGLRHTKTFPIEIFRKMMGVPRNKYLKFKDFKKRVINQAVREVNTFSDIYIEPELQRQARRVINIRFLLKRKAKRKRFTVPISKQIIDSSLYEKAQKNYFLDNKILETLIRKFGENKIEETMVQIESSSSYLAGKIKNLAGYLINALEKGYQFPISSAQVLEEEHIEKNRQVFLKERQEKALAELKRKYERYVNITICNVFEQQDDIDKKSILKKFEQSLREDKNFMALKSLNKDLLQNPMVQVFFRIFFIEKYPKLCPNVLNFEEFCLKQNQRQCD